MSEFCEHCKYFVYTMDIFISCQKEMGLNLTNMVLHFGNIFAVFSGLKEN